MIKTKIVKPCKLIVKNKILKLQLKHSYHKNHFEQINNKNKKFKIFNHMSNLLLINYKKIK
jgi:hypothetical protein